MTTELLFRDDAYLKTIAARVIAVHDRGIELDRTIFYPQGGGQLGDTGVLVRENGERIAWDARGLGVLAYHAWLIWPTAEGCHVLTEESQHGWAARLGNLVRPTRMSHYHQLWLERLRNCAAGGFPPRP